MFPFSRLRKKVPRRGGRGGLGSAATFPSPAARRAPTSPSGGRGERGGRVYFAVLSGAAPPSPSTTTLALIFGDGQIGEVMPAATATRWPAPVS